MKTKAFFLQALTPVHPGTEQSVESVIDLPVAREKSTGIPIIPASTIKGVLRGRYEDEKLAKELFGYAPESGNDEKARRATESDEVGIEHAPESGDDGKAASLTFTDARLLLLPVRSFWGGYALLTSPSIISRWRRDAQLLGIPAHSFEPVTLFNDYRILLPSNSALPQPLGQGKAKAESGADLAVVLEDFDFKAKPLPENWAHRFASTIFSDPREAENVERHLAVVSDSVFAHFARHGLEVIARVQLDPQQKTVKEGPWYEENVPAEAIFSFFALAEREDYLAEVNKHALLQLGGQTSIGRGLVRTLEAAHGK